MSLGTDGLNQPYLCKLRKTEINALLMLNILLKYVGLMLLE